jgi:hypothetical protein
VRYYRIRKEGSAITRSRVQEKKEFYKKITNKYLKNIHDVLKL